MASPLFRRAAAHTAYREDLGLIVADGIDGTVMLRKDPPENRVFEVRATVTSGGDYLAAVCAGSGIMAGQSGKKSTT